MRGVLGEVAKLSFEADVHLPQFNCEGFKVLFGKDYHHESWPAKTYAEPYQVSKMDLLVEIVKGFQELLTIFVKSSFIDVWYQGSEQIQKYTNAPLGKYIKKSTVVC